jgi:HEAT repeat protein
MNELKKWILRTMLLVMLVFYSILAMAQELSFLKKNPELKAELKKYENEAPQEIKKQIQILREDNSVECAYAAIRLGNIGADAKGAILALIETFENWEWLEWSPTHWPTTAAWEAARALYKIGEPALIPLLEALKDENPNVRRSAAMALRDMNDSRSIKPLIAALMDKNIFVRKDVEEALYKVDPNWRQSNAAKEIVPNFIEALKDTSVSGDAVSALGVIRDSLAVCALIEALKDERVRGSAASALGDIKDSRSVKPLITALMDKNIWVREGVEEALYKVDPNWRQSNAAKEVVPSFIEILRDNDKAIRKAAGWALKSITGQNFKENYKRWMQWWQEEQNKRK